MCEGYYHPDDVERFEAEDERRELEQDHAERVCDLWSPMWFSEQDLRGSDERDE